MKKKTQLRPAVLLVPSAIFIVVIILSLVIGQPFTDTLTKGFEVLQYNLGWVVSLTMLLFVAFVAVVIFHPIGKIKLGGPNAKPKMSYGRTLREFVVVNWLMPCLFGFIWFAIFGGTVLYQQFYGGVDYYSIYLEKGMEAMTLEAFNSVPFAPVIKAFMLLIIAVSFITLANSMISTIASMSIKNSSENEEAPFGLKLFWGIIIAAAALVFTLAGGIDGVKMVKTFAGFPIVFLGIVMIVGFIIYMAKRPRDAAGNFEYEEAIANAPDNGEPCAPPSPTMEKLKAWIHSKKK